MSDSDTGGAQTNWRASPIGLYDMPSPRSPEHLTLRYAIHEHRNGRREPVVL